MTINHASLFSGIGGFDLAADWIGWNNLFNCDSGEFCKKVLKYYWPKAINYGDIKQTNFAIWRGKINILSGGFPCQPYSTAGKRRGKEDDRHLWPEMLRAIREIQPTYIVGENVPGIVNWSGGDVFEEVQANLEAEGYEVQPIILPACGVDAPHRRERVWFVAYSKSKQGKRMQPEQSEISKQKQREFGRGDCGISGEWDASNANIIRGIQNHVKLKAEKFKYVGPGWNKFPTQSPICGRNDGFSSKLDEITFPMWRSESIKAYGNAVVPQLVYEIFKVIHEHIKLTSK